MNKSETLREALERVVGDPADPAAMEAIATLEALGLPGDLIGEALYHFGLAVGGDVAAAVGGLLGEFDPLGSARFEGFTGETLLRLGRSDGGDGDDTDGPDRGEGGVGSGSTEHDDLPGLALDPGVDHDESVFDDVVDSDRPAVGSVFDPDQAPQSADSLTFGSACDESEYDADRDHAADMVDSVRDTHPDMALVDDGTNTDFNDDLQAYAAGSDVDHLDEATGGVADA